MAKPRAGSVDVHRWRGDGLVVCDRAKHFAFGAGTGDFGRAGVVGVSDGVAPFDAGGTGVLDAWEVGGYASGTAGAEVIVGRWVKIRKSGGEPPQSKIAKIHRLRGAGAQDSWTQKVLAA